MATGTTSSTETRIGEYISSARFEDLSSAAVERAKDLVAHLLGAALAGYRTNLAEQTRSLMHRLAPAGPATIGGDPIRTGIGEAAFANAASMAVTGIDDFLLPGGTHPGQVTLPATLALAEELGRSGQELITAMAAGYEVLGKLSGTVWSWEGRTPQRATIPFGAFGPAAGCARLLELSAEESANAVALGAHAVMGLTNDPFSPHVYAYAARNGLTAALMAERGIRVAPDSLSGPHGFFDTVFGLQPDGLDEAVASLGREPELLKAGFKFIPTTGMNRTCIGLMMGLRDQHALDPDAVGAITLHVSNRRVNHQVGYSAGPFDDRWQAVSSAQFNMAVALVDGDVALERYDDFTDPTLVSLVERTTVRFEDVADLTWARLEITTTDGSRVSAETSGHTFPQIDRRERLGGPGAGIVGDTRVDAAVAMIDGLDEVDDIRDLTELLRPA